MSDRLNTAERSVGLLDRLEAPARLELHNLAGLDCDLGAIARATPNTGLARAQVKDGESAKLDALARARACFILSKMLSTAASALRLEIPVRPTTSLMMSSLIKAPARWPRHRG
jgi:hypothetical protein